MSEAIFEILPSHLRVRTGNSLNTTIVPVPAISVADLVTQAGNSAFLPLGPAFERSMNVVIIEVMLTVRPQINERLKPWTIIRSRVYL